MPISDQRMSARRDLPAGGFSCWLRRTLVALTEEGEADVPCGECSACCTTSHFVHVGPEETQTLARIPRELLFPAPGLPAGNVLMGYNEQGCCPMLTCRTYDCRVFAAAGITADSDPITRQARRWKFDHPTSADRDQHAAVRAAARFVRERVGCFPGGAAARDPVHVALLAINAYEVFLERGDEPGATAQASSDLDVVRAVMEVDERFAAARAAAQASPRAGRRGAAPVAGRAVRQDEPDG